MGSIVLSGRPAIKNQGEVGVSNDSRILDSVVKWVSSPHRCRACKKESILPNQNQCTGYSSRKILDPTSEWIPWLAWWFSSILGVKVHFYSKRHELVGRCSNGIPWQDSDPSPLPCSRLFFKSNGDWVAEVTLSPPQQPALFCLPTVLRAAGPTSATNASLIQWQNKVPEMDPSVCLSHTQSIQWFLKI